MAAVIGSFTSQTATGAQTVSSGLGEEIGILFLWGGEASGLVTTELRYSTGVAAKSPSLGTISRAVVATAMEGGGASPTNMARDQSPSNVAIEYDAAQVVTRQGDLTAFAANGDFTITWTAAGAALVWLFLAISKAGLMEAEVRAQTLTTGAGTQDFTGYQSTPDFVYIIHKNGVAADQTHMMLGVGCAVSSAVRWCGSIGGQDGQTMATQQNCSKLQRTNAVMTGNTTGGVLEMDVDFSAFLSGGFRLNKVTAPAASKDFFALCTTGMEVDLTSGDSPTGGGNQSDASFAFPPQAVLFQAWGQPANTAIVVDATLGQGAGGPPSNAEQFAGLNADDGSLSSCGTTNVSTQAIRCPADIGAYTLDSEATFVSMNADGFTINWGDPPDVSEQWLAVGFRAVAMPEEDYDWRAPRPYPEPEVSVCA